ncbi:hypothetical protein HPB50_001095 [Hyalomma asiaticum]|uniref:Uncharacterized protein n=1 Tax=Hyalomma asiaticum TaxID=266040 RepID=A0ACB7TCZ0_HYAAI|nr:hypothetical protein HPB50_001095 [Hyalomma asiaticum]
MGAAAARCDPLGWLQLLSYLPERPLQCQDVSAATHSSKVEIPRSAGIRHPPTYTTAWRKRPTTSPPPLSSTARAQYIASSSASGEYIPPDPAAWRSRGQGAALLGSPPGVALFHPDSDLVN